jgi:glycosyltransferase involved in cell wall biosynthesis
MRRIRDALIKWRPPEVEFVDWPTQDAIHILDWIGQDPEVEDAVLHPKDSLFKEVPSLPRTEKYVILYHIWNVNYHAPEARKRVRDKLAALNRIFTNAALVITYSPYLTKYHPVINPVEIEWEKVNAFVTPWGYDPDKFYNMCLPRDYLVMATGYVAETEFIREVYEAARRAGGRMIHVGGDVGIRDVDNYERREGISDDEMLMLYNRSVYVNAMRDTVGFEVVGVEGLACGCTPIYLDLPCYRYWLDGMAIFVPPSRYGMVERLEEIFRRGLTVAVDRRRLREKFSWEYVAPRIWRAILEAVRG